MTRKETRKFTLKDLDHALSLSRLLAKAFPEPEECVTGIYELLVNAIEHGNLGIGLEVKSDLLKQGKWQEEILRRASLPENTAKQVDIELKIDGQTCRLKIRDQGNGFSWKHYKKSLAPSTRPNGRGLYIAFHSKFDTVSFNPTGNEVTCTASYGSTKSRRPY